MGKFKNLVSKLYKEPGRLLGSLLSLPGVMAGLVYTKVSTLRPDLYNDILCQNIYGMNISSNTGVTAGVHELGHAVAMAGPRFYEMNIYVSGFEHLKNGLCSLYSGDKEMGFKELLKWLTQPSSGYCATPGTSTEPLPEPPKMPTNPWEKLEWFRVFSAGTLSEFFSCSLLYLLGRRVRKKHPNLGSALKSYSVMWFIDSAQYPMQTAFFPECILDWSRYGHDWAIIQRLTKLNPTIIAAAYLASFPIFLTYLELKDRKNARRVAISKSLKLLDEKKLEGFFQEFKNGKDIRILKCRRLQKRNGLLERYDITTPLGFEDNISKEGEKTLWKKFWSLLYDETKEIRNTYGDFLDFLLTNKEIKEYLG